MNHSKMIEKKKIEPKKADETDEDKFTAEQDAAIIAGKGSVPQKSWAEIAAAIGKKKDQVQVRFKEINPNKGGGNEHQKQNQTDAAEKHKEKTGAKQEGGRQQQQQQQERHGKHKGHEGAGGGGAKGREGDKAARGYLDSKQMMALQADENFSAEEVRLLSPINDF